jgi:hypothetical protein
MLIGSWLFTRMREVFRNRGNLELAHEEFLSSNL